METYNTQSSTDIQQTAPLKAVSSQAATMQAVLLVIILFTGAALRLNNIAQPFTDVFSWAQTGNAMIAENFHNRNPNILFPQVHWNGVNPSYQGRDLQIVSYITAIFFAAGWQDAWVARSVTVAFGLWSIYALYQLVRRVWDEQRALASAAVLAVLPGAVFIDRSFLPDPAAVAFALTSLWLLVAYLQTDNWLYLLLATLIGALAILTKLSVAIVGLPAMYAIWAILRARGQLTQSRVVALGTAGLLILLLAAVYYFWMRRLALAHPPRTFIGLGNWLWNDSLQTWLNGRYFIPELLDHLLNWMWTPFIIALMVLGFLVPQRWLKSNDTNDQQAGAPWFFHWWLLAGVIYYVIAARELVRTPWLFHILNALAAALAANAIVFMAVAFDRALQKLPLFKASRLRQAGFLIIGTAAIVLPVALNGLQGLQSLYAWPGGEESYRLGLALREVARPSELVVTIANEFDNPTAIYYSRRRGWVFPPARGRIDQVRFPESDEEAIAMLDDLREQGARWLGITNARLESLLAAHPAFTRYIARTGEQVSQTSDFIIFRLLRSEEVSPIVVTQEIWYTAPEAGRVFLVWGVDGWQQVPESIWPAGSILKNALHTPMARRGDTFVTTIQVPIGAALNYGFLTTHNRAGAIIEDVWEQAQDVPRVREDGIIEKQAGADSQLTPRLVTQQILYHAPEAVTEVILVWGINDWQLAPESMRPAGTTIQDAALHTPMYREGDVFIFGGAVPAGTIINYGFLVTEKRQGITIKTLWDQQPNYQVTVDEAGVIEIDAAQTLPEAESLFDLTDIILPKSQ